MKILLKHVRKAELCNEQLRKFATRYNLDWNDFVKNGIEIENLEHIDDAMVHKLIDEVGNN